MSRLRSAAIACALGWAAVHLLFLFLQRPVAASQGYAVAQGWATTLVEAALAAGAAVLVAVQSRARRTLRPAGVVAGVALAWRLWSRRAIPDLGDHPLPILLLSGLDILALALLVAAVPLLLIDPK